jgi:hypothetical protein
MLPLKPINDTTGPLLSWFNRWRWSFSSKKQQLVIVFNLLDIQLAYFIKKTNRFFGNVRKVKIKCSSVVNS